MQMKRWVRETHICHRGEFNLLLSLEIIMEVSKKNLKIELGYDRRYCPLGPL